MALTLPRVICTHVEHKQSCALHTPIFSRLYAACQSDIPLTCFDISHHRLMSSFVFAFLALFVVCKVNFPLRNFAIIVSTQCKRSFGAQVNARSPRKSAKNEEQVKRWEAVIWPQRDHGKVVKNHFSVFVVCANVQTRSSRFILILLL